MDSVVNSSTLVSIGRNVGQHFSENVLARFGPESLAFLNRNDWLLCAGLGGVFGAKYAFFDRIDVIAHRITATFIEPENVYRFYVKKVGFKAVDGG
jgi:hypothetical protein